MLLHASFRPYAVRFEAEGQRHTQFFALPNREPLFLEFELVLRAPGTERPAVTFTLNDARAEVVQGATSFTIQRRHVLLPFDAVRQGENWLHVALDPPASASFDLRARIHNYYGIAPDFPRAVVVADSAVDYLFAQRSSVDRAIGFSSTYLACVAALWVLALARPAKSPAGAVLLLIPSVVPGLALGYSLATPLHLWLSLPALVIVSVVPWVCGVLSLWIAARRRTAARVAVVAIVTLLLLEGSLRLFNYFSPTFIFYSDSYNRYRGQPGAPHYDARLNARGFNDVERAVVRPADVRNRIVALGDSFAVGVVPRSSNYLALLERELSDVGPVEVINMGVSATEPRDYLALLVNEGLAFAPDLVLVGFYVGNDFETGARRLHEYSFVLTLGRALWRIGSAGLAVAQPGDAHAVYTDDEPSMATERFLEIQVDRARIYDRDSAWLSEAAGRAAGYLREMRDLSRRTGADMLVVLIPDETQVDPALLAAVAQALGRAPGDFDVEQPNRAITAALEAAGIPLLDLLPAFVDRSPRGRLYKPQDTHWNIAGNRVAAVEIAQALRERLAARVRAPAAP